MLASAEVTDMSKQLGYADMLAADYSYYSRSMLEHTCSDPSATDTRLLTAASADMLYIMRSAMRSKRGAVFDTA